MNDLKKRNLELISEHAPLLQWRKIRSFVRRTGRMTKAQEDTYVKAFAEFGLYEDNGFISEIATFGREARLNVEIGFGMGDSLAAMANQAPEENFIGIEVHTPGIGSLLQIILHQEIKNIRIFEADAINVFSQALRDTSIDRLQIYFPDPWHKRKHYKRRLVNQAFLDLVVPKLKPQGLIHVATDWKPYAEHVHNVFKQRQDFKRLSTNSETSLVAKPVWRPETKFERRGRSLGHQVYDLLFEKML